MEGSYVQQFKKGALEMMLLCLINRGETYGYEVIRQLNDSGAAVLGYAKEGTVYPILYRLQEGGLVQARMAPSAANGGSKKYYAMTDKGRQVLRDMVVFWRAYSTLVEDFIDKSGALEGKEGWKKDIFAR